MFTLGGTLLSPPPVTAGLLKSHWGERGTPPSPAREWGGGGGGVGADGGRREEQLVKAREGREGEGDSASCAREKKNNSKRSRDAPIALHPPPPATLT